MRRISIALLALAIAACGGDDSESCTRVDTSNGYSVLDPARAPEWPGPSVQAAPGWFVTWHGRLWESVGYGRNEPGTSPQWVDRGAVCAD